MIKNQTKNYQKSNEKLPKIQYIEKNKQNTHIERVMKSMYQKITRQIA